MKMIAPIGTSIQKYSKEISIALLLASTVFLFAPLTVFVVNKGIIPVSLKDVWPGLLLYTLIAFTGLVFPSILFRKARKLLVSGYIGLAIAFTVQGNLPIYNIGKLDGQVIRWSDYYQYLPIEILLWAGIIGACIYFRKALYKNSFTVVMLLAAINLLPTIGLSISTNSSSPSSNTSKFFDFSKEFEFSNQKNVIIIVLDTFRSDAFAEILKDNPQYSEDFKDFTYFSNTSGGYPTTKPSVPLILSGIYYDNSMPMSEFLDAHNDQSLPYFLVNNGLNVEGYFFSSPVFRDWQNRTAGIPIDHIRKHLKKQLFVTFIRYSPLPLKQYFVGQYYEGEDFFHKSVVDFYTRAPKTQIKNKPAVFKYIHLSGAHSPYQLDGSFQRVDNGYFEQAKASLNAVIKLLEGLQAVGAYDNSLIIITGDHGSNVPLPLDYIQINATGNNPTILTREMIGHGYPLLLAKSFNQTNNSITQSHIPVSLMDIPRTVADTLGLENQFPGYSIFADIPHDRVRKYFYYKWSHLDWNQPYLPSMFEFEIHGDILDSSAWQFQFKEYKEGLVKEVIFPNYQYGDNIVETIFSTERGSFFSPGFERTVENRSGGWGLAPVACTQLQVHPTNKVLSLSIQGHSLQKDGVKIDQALQVEIDRERVATVDSANQITITLPSETAAGTTQDGRLHLCFYFPDVRSPKELGINTDTRLLGYYFTEISIIEMEYLSLPLEIRFSKDSPQPPKQIQYQGFSGAEAEFRWIDGKEATINIPVHNGGRDIVLELSARPFIVPGELNDQKLIIQANNKLIKEFVIRETGVYSVTIPAQDISDMLEISLLTPNATSPSSLGISQDKRSLGIALSWIRLREQ